MIAGSRSIFDLFGFVKFRLGNLKVDGKALKLTLRRLSFDSDFLKIVFTIVCLLMRTWNDLEFPRGPFQDSSMSSFSKAFAKLDRLVLFTRNRMTHFSSFLCSGSK